MHQGKKVVVIMPAYNAQHTLRRTCREVMEQGLVDLVIVVDDASHDETARVAVELEDVELHVHERNLGYGGNQKTCYRLALQEEGDIVIMVHPDYQYTPKLLPAMVGLPRTRIGPSAEAESHAKSASANATWPRGFRGRPA